MFRNDTRKWLRGCLIVPCLMATLTFGMVGCGGGTDDATGTGTGDTSTDTDTGAGTDGTETTTE